jgi:MFS family permease
VRGQPIEKGQNRYMGGFAAFFSGRDMPYMSRALYAVELRTWTLLAVTIGAVESGVVGVLVKNVYAGQIDNTLLNFAVAVASGAAAYANLLSFVFGWMAHGRNKVQALVVVQILTCLFLLVIAVAPISVAGLFLVIAGVIGSRACWSGVITQRAVIWRANFPRNVRAGFAGRTLIASAIVMAATGLAIGFLMDTSETAFRYIYPLAAVIGIWAALLYRRIRVRGHHGLLRAERDNTTSGTLNTSLFWRVLRNDALFRRYQLWMFVFGGGNMMITSLLVLVLAEQLQVSRLAQVFIISSLPLIVMPLATPFWSRRLDRMHVIQYRATNSWIFVAAATCIWWGALSSSIAVLALGTALWGTGFAGGVLSWNLGHNDFAPPEEVTHYMSVHVTLTGMRGVISPILGVSLYELLESYLPGAGAWALGLPLALVTTGALGFQAMKAAQNASKTD